MVCTFSFVFQGHAKMAVTAYWVQMKAVSWMHLLQALGKKPVQSIKIRDTHLLKVHTQCLNNSQSVKLLTSRVRGGEYPTITRCPSMENPGLSCWKQEGFSTAHSVRGTHRHSDKKNRENIMAAFFPSQTLASIARKSGGKVAPAAPKERDSTGVGPTGLVTLNPVMLNTTEEMGTCIRPMGLR